MCVLLHVILRNVLEFWVGMLGLKREIAVSKSAVVLLRYLLAIQRADEV
jgi:hypothetical protein